MRLEYNPKDYGALLDPSLMTAPIGLRPRDSWAPQRVHYFGIMRQ